MGWWRSRLDTAGIGGNRGEDVELGGQESSDRLLANIFRDCTFAMKYRNLRQSPQISLVLILPKIENDLCILIKIFSILVFIAHSYSNKCLVQIYTITMDLFVSQLPAW